MRVISFSSQITNLRKSEATSKLTGMHVVDLDANFKTALVRLKLDKTDRKKTVQDSMGTFNEVCHQRLCGKVSVNKIFFLATSFNNGQFNRTGCFEIILIIML